MKKTKVSIIIPAYNRKNYLVEVLKYLNQQNYNKEELEVIVVDNGSTDGTKSLVENSTYEFKLKVIELPRENNFDAAKLRNTGAAVADGEVLIFIDSDILVPPKFVSNHIRFYDNSDDLACVIGSVYYLENKKYQYPIHEILEHERLTLDPLENEYSKYNECGTTNPLIWMMFHSGNISMTRKVFEMTGGFDEWHKEWSIEDLDFGYQIYKRGIPIYYSKNAYGLHKWHHNDAKNTDSIDNGFSYLISKENNNALISCVYDNYRKKFNCLKNHMQESKFYDLEKYINYKKMNGNDNICPILTVAIYSNSAEYSNLVNILKTMDAQYNGKFEVLLINDCMDEVKSMYLQKLKFRFDLRILNVNWRKEKEKLLLDKVLFYKQLSGQDLTGMDKGLASLIHTHMSLYEEEIKNKFEQLVYDQAIGLYVKFSDDKTSCGSTYISDIWRDFIV